MEVDITRGLARFLWEHRGMGKSRLACMTRSHDSKSHLTGFVYFKFQFHRSFMEYRPKADIGFCWRSLEHYHLCLLPHYQHRHASVR